MLTNLQKCLYQSQNLFSAINVRYHKVSWDSRPLVLFLFLYLSSSLFSIISSLFSLFLSLNFYLSGWIPSVSHQLYVLVSAVLQDFISSLVGDKRGEKGPTNIRLVQVYYLISLCDGPWSLYDKTALSQKNLVFLSQFHENVENFCEHFNELAKKLFCDQSMQLN